MIDATMQSAGLGPAVVRRLSGGRLTVLREGVEIDAQNALAFPYSPRVGDEVLLIGDERAAYVIGVLRASGDFTMHFPANAHFHARGAFQFTSAEAIELQAPVAKVTAGKWEVVARMLSEKVHNATRWVKELSTLRAGRRKVQVEGVNVERAERHVLRAKEDVRVNGKKIHLG